MRSRTRGLVVFLAISFAGTFLIAPVVRFGLDMPLDNPLAQLPVAFMPAIAAFVVRRWVTREGFRDAGLRWQLRTQWRYYLIAWLGPLALAVAALGIAVAAGLWRSNLDPLDQVVPGLPGWALLLILMLVVPLLTPVYWGEEFGWTSYLRMRLYPGRPLAATVGTGLIWAVWHYPLAFLGYLDLGNVALGLAVWTGSFLAQEIVLSWLWTSSGSIWPPSLAHAGNNMVLALLPGILLAEGAALDTIVVLAIIAAPIALVSAWLLGTRRYRGPISPGPVSQSLAHQPKHR